VPSADRPVAVPGLGLCLPERVGEGWLVRPHTPGHQVRARLDVAACLLEVDTDTESWRTPLTRRHVDLLGLVAAAGPGGTTAGRLSTALYGDADHAVTVRAEISRLRRAVGAILETNPYRVATGVSLAVAAPESGAVAPTDAQRPA
jgi:hypothetical protein